MTWRWPGIPEFKPSEVLFGYSALPLIGTFGRAEDELAAALIVLGCVHHGDLWQPVHPKQIGAAIQAELQPGGALHDVNKNPFCPSPDLRALVKKGFAEFEGDPDGAPAAPISFTEKGMSVLWKETTHYAHLEKVREVMES